MLETLIALVTAVLLAAPTGQSVEITNTVTRDGEGVHQRHEVLLDGTRWGAGYTHMDCSTPTRDTICDVMEQTPNLVVRYRIHRSADRKVEVRTEILVGTVTGGPYATINCVGITGNALCDAFELVYP